MSESIHVLDVTPAGRWTTKAAEVMAAAITNSIDRRNRCLLGVSGGSTPTPVFAELARHDLEWSKVTVIQVDERIVPLDSSSRNLMVQRGLLGDLGCSWLPLPVDELLTLRGRPPSAQDQPRLVGGSDAAEILQRFSAGLVSIADDPPVIDVIHLGLGADGHTASLVPGDPLVDELRTYVALTGLYSGSPPNRTQTIAALDKADVRPTTQRVSLTRPVLDRARVAVWLVQGADKARSLKQLYSLDPSIPAGLIRPAHSVIVADSDAAAFIS